MKWKKLGKLIKLWRKNQKWKSAGLLDGDDQRCYVTIRSSRILEGIGFIPAQTAVHYEELQQTSDAW